jgi:hypothetical protein
MPAPHVLNTTQISWRHDATKKRNIKMTFKTVTCAIVMGSALLFGGAAYADTMVGSSTVTDADLPAVQARCDMLATSDNASLTQNTDDNVAPESNDGAADATDNQTSAVDEAQAATTTSIDLDTVTAEQCKAAGLTK